jgi:hypothetical protein
MATPAQGVQQAIMDGLQRAQNRKQELEDEKRKVTLKTLQDDAETPQDKVAAIDAVYHKDPGVLKQHVENLTRKLTGQPTQPVVSPAQAQQSRLAPIAARGVTPDQQALKQRGAEGQQDLALQTQTQQAEQKRTFDLIDQYVKDPEKNQALKRDYIAKQAGVPLQRTLKEFTSPDGQQRNWFTPGEEPPGWNATQGATKPPLPKLTTVNGHRVLIDPSTGKITHDLGAASEVRTTTRETPITDANGVVHIERLTSVSVPGMGQVTVDDDSAQQPSSKGPAPKKASGGGGTATPKGAAPRSSSGGGKTLDFQKATPAGNKARSDFAEATKLNSIAQQVAQHPDDAINQKRLAVALERASAGRFTVQALDYIVKSGWGNTIEQWANNPTTGALPKDVVRQLVDGASQNLKASKDAIDAVDDLGSKGPAPKSAPKKDDSKDPLGVL